MSAEEEEIAKALRADAQWKADVLQTLTEIRSYAEATAQAEHAQLAALGEILACLRLPPDPAYGEEPPPTVADLLADLLEATDDVAPDATDETEGG